MRNRIGLALGIAILMGGSACMAQSKPARIQQPQANAATLPQAPQVARVEIAVLRPSSLSTSSTVHPMVGSYVVARPTERVRLGARFYLLNGLNIGMTALDMSLSQRCIAAHRCREANILMPRSVAARISVVAVFTALGTYASRRMKVRGIGLWWVPPLFGTVAHGIGVVSGLAQP